VHRPDNAPLVSEFSSSVISLITIIYTTGGSVVVVLGIAPLQYTYIASLGSVVVIP
jgi:hypothetical protein